MYSTIVGLREGERRRARVAPPGHLPTYDDRCMIKAGVASQSRPYILYDTCDITVTPRPAISYSMQRNSNGGRQSTLVGWKKSKDSKCGVGDKHIHDKRMVHHNESANSINVSVGVQHDIDSTSVTRKKRSRPSSPTLSSNAPNIALHTRPNWENTSLHNAPMFLLRSYIGGMKSSERKAARNDLSTLPDWNDNVTFNIFGKECKMRRRICQYSSGGNISYSYSGLKKNTTNAPDFPPILYQIKCQVETLICDYIMKLLNENDGTILSTINSDFVDMVKTMNQSKDAKKKEIYNYCLLNHYRNGEEYMGYHSDDETSLYQNIPIASVSLGVTRHFDIKPKKKNSEGKRPRAARIDLGDGDLLLMFKPMQDHYEHQIPVEKRVTGERINLTFRRIIN